MDIKNLNDIPPWEWPEDTDEVLLAILRDHRAQAGERLLAAELAGDYTVVNDEIALALLSIVVDGKESEKIRAQAAISLGPALEDSYVNAFDEPDENVISEEVFHKITKSLRKLYLDTNTPKLVRRKILEGSVRAPQDWQREEILSAYSSKDAEWVLTAVFCMQFVRGFDEQILESLKNQDEDIHYEAIVAAGNWELNDAWPHIRAILKAKRMNKPLLLVAIEAAPFVSPEEAQEILIDLCDSSDDEIAEAADEALSASHELLDDMYEFERDEDEYGEYDDEEEGFFN